MHDALLIITTSIALLTAGWAGVAVLRDRLPSWYLVGLLGALELTLLVTCVVGIIQVATTEDAVAGGTIVAYLVAQLVLVPAATLWALVERSRFGTAVIIIACLAVPAMLLRVDQLWTAGRG